MSMSREIVNAALWQGRDPFLTTTARPNAAPAPADACDHESLVSLGFDDDVAPLPRVVVVAGAGNGAVTIRLARLFQERRHDGVIIAVDTWLGSWKDWSERDASGQFRQNSGRVALQEAFLQRVRAEGADQHVVPLPLDDLNASALFRRKRLSIDLLHLNLCTGRMPAQEQLDWWWTLLRDGGRLVADIEHHDQYSFLQAMQTLEMFAEGHGAAFKSIGNIVRIDKGAGGAAFHPQTHVLGELPEIPRTLDYEGEFGPELVLFLPYVTWLSRAGLLRQTRVVIYAGMRCFYDHLQCAELVEKHASRRYVKEEQRLPNLPVKSELLYDVADLSPFHVFPDFRHTFRRFDLPSAFDRLRKPLLVIHNKFAIEWNREPINHIGLDLLDTLIRELTRAFTIVYIRHGMTREPAGYSKDDNFSLSFDDRSVLEAHPEVLCFDDVYADYVRNGGIQDVNTFKNVLYSRCHHFISSQGGGAAHMSFFSGSLLMILHRYGREERLAYGNGPYGFCANPAPIRVICLNDEELVRGLRLFKDSTVVADRVMIAHGLEPLLEELSPWTLEKRRDGKWSR
jgi:hypothetical protein